MPHNRSMRVALVLLLFFSLPSAAQELRWFKGNTHTHTVNSDGDSTPDEVVRWYREHGYNFLVLTDHNYLTPVDGLKALHDAPGKFIVIQGEEVSDRFGSKQIHVNGLDVESLVEPQGGDSAAGVVQRNVDAIRGAKGVPHVNHPNFNWALTADDLAKISGMKLFEIFNGHPLVNLHGGGERPSLEQMWDELLSRGVVLYGLAVDDAHHFKRPGDRNASLPGQGWIVVRAGSLETETILDAIERGEFYSSTGVELEDVLLSPELVRIAIRPRGETIYTSTFIGRGGEVLLETAANPAVYEPRGDEGYVRVRIRDSNGLLAWTQPVLLGD